MRGTPIILDYKGVEISGIWQSNSGPSTPKSKKKTESQRQADRGQVSFAFGVYLKDADFDAIIKYCVGDIGVSLSWLNSLKASEYTLSQARRQLKSLGGIRACRRSIF